jgi:DNA-binding NarL/FixJ family response regulator
MTEIRVVVADDHPVFRSGLRVLLEVDPDIVVAGEAGTGAEAVDLAARLRPDLVMMDLHMPDLDGIAATKQILHDDPAARILVFTMFDDDDSVFAAMRAGARGYLLKGSSPGDVIHAVHLVISGGAMFGPAVAQRVIEFFARPRPAGAIAVFPQLTDREHEILDLVPRGQSNPSIASRLYISEKTVRNHVSSIFTKLAVADRAQAIARARDAGLGS